MGSGTLRRLKEHTFMDANKRACVKASRELHSALARYTWTEASTIVKSVTRLAEVEEFSKSTRITAAERREGYVTYPKPANDVCWVRLMVMRSGRS